MQSNVLQLQGSWSEVVGCLVDYVGRGAWFEPARTRGGIGFHDRRLVTLESLPLDQSEHWLKKHAAVLSSCGAVDGRHAKTHWLA